MLTGNIKTEISPKDIRKNFRTALKSGKLLRMPGAFSPFVALIIEQIGFEGIYISGAGISNDLGLPDIGLTTLPEVVQRGHAIGRSTKLPTLIDIDTGFGEVLNVARTIQEIENVGLSGVHIEDQTNPKRCGHLDNKALVTLNAMSLKIKAAANAKRDENFLIMARTDAAASEGLDAAIDRAKAYIDAGAEAIFPEALGTEKDFEKFRKAIPVPLLANMTEFGKSKLLSTQTLSDLGFNIVIYPMSSFRFAMKSVEEGLKAIYQKGTQESVVPQMQTRARLYEILKYEEYNAFDKNIFTFDLSNNSKNFEK
jgi:methylisocitrate lyase